MELTLALDARSDRPLQTQIFDQVRRLILSGGLRPNMALPPSRALAAQMRVSRNTVLLAYERLAAEGYVESRATAGVFVAPIPPDDLLRMQGAGALDTNGPIPEPPGEPLLCFAGSPGGGGDRPALDFWVGRSDPAMFPLQAWRRIVSRLLASESTYLTDYCDPAGLPALRKAIADHLGRARGMSVADDQIIVTAGGQDALNLVVNLLSGHTRQLCIENPCYLGASMLFSGTGLAIHTAPVDGEGLVVERLPQARGSLLYVTPSHQFPTGAMMTLPRRLALLRWAEETDSFIVEDDYDSDFRYDGPPLTSLAGLDRGRRVLYAGTFSKSVGAGLRLGFAAVPRLMWDDARMLKARMSNGQSWLEQAALASFLDEGHFDRHLRRLRQVYKGRRDALVAALRANFRKPAITGAESGLHLVWRLPPGSPPARDVQAAARRQGVGAYALSSGAAFDFSADPPDDALVLGYSSLDETRIAAAVARLRLLLDDWPAAVDRPARQARS